MTDATIERHSPRKIFLFWAPLAATWVMMAVEGPFLAAVIARLADAKFNLAAHGVAFAFAILVEAPVMMLMSASTALVKDRLSYGRMLRFTWALNGLATGMLVAVLVPPVHELVTRTLLGLPPEVADLTYGALWLFLPWPAAIGYRRFLHGLLIRSGRTRLVALGTLIRLTGMSATGLALYFLASVPGAWVGAASLSVGVIIEAVAAWLMARPTVAELRGTRGSSRDDAGSAGSGPEPAGEIRRGNSPDSTEVGGLRPTGARGEIDSPDGASTGGLGYREIVSFYYPLALTSIIGITVQPLLTFLMGRAPAPVESLAVFPVVSGLVFIFRAPGLGYQEAAIALLGDRCEHWPEVSRFATWVGLASSGALALVAFTPLADVWFVTLSGLTPELASFALDPAMIMAPLPALTFFMSLQRGVLVQDRRTRPVTVASVIEIAGIALLFSLFGWGMGVVGVTAAALGFVGGRLGATGFLIRPVKDALESMR